MVLEDRAERNKIRSVIYKARDRDIMSQEEVGFVVTLVERFRNDADKKMKQLTMLQGEIAQLKASEKIIMDLIQNMIAAAERDVARRETMERLKESKEVEKERHRARAEENAAKENEEPTEENKEEEKK